MPSQISVNGLQVRYLLEGPEDAPVVTFSHSLSANLTMWDAQAEALRSRYRVLRYDTRGHGGTTATEGPYTLEQLADDAAGLLRALGIARTHFVGLSLGGMVGQTLALAHPELLRTLTLCDTSSGYGPEAREMWRQRIEAAQKNGLESNIEQTIERWFSPGYVGRAAETIDRVREMIRSTPVAGYVGCGHAISKLALTERISGISVPTLIIVGEDDPGTPVEMHRIIHDRIAGSELVVIPTARHLSNIEAAEEFNGALVRFLGAH